LFEALRRCDAATGGLQLVAPVNGDGLRSLLQPGQAVLRDDPAVLWLDDLEPFLNQGVTLQTLREWHSGATVRIVTATYGGKGSDLVAGSTIGGLPTIATDVLQHGREVTLDRTTTDELRPLQAKLSESEFDTLRQHGLAAYLVAGPLLQRKLTTGRQAPGDPACLEGIAVVNAAIDWARCGRTDPMGDDTLRSLWPHYLPSETLATDDGLRVGLGWALQPVAASICLLEQTDGYQAFDYVVRLRQQQPNNAPPHPAAWSAAITTASPVQAHGVGQAAFFYNRNEDAVEALNKAGEAHIDEVAAKAGVLLGLVLTTNNRPEDAIQAFQRVIDRFDGYDYPAMRRLVADALTSQGRVLFNSDRLDEAMAVNQRVIEHLGDEPDPDFRASVASAMCCEGDVLVRLDRLQDAMVVYQRVFDGYGDDSSPNIRVTVGQSLRGQAGVLKVMGRLEDSLAAYQHVIDYHAKDPDPNHPMYHGNPQIGLVLYEQGALLKALGRLDDAIAAYQRFIDGYGDFPYIFLFREKIAWALYHQGLLFKQLGRPEDAMAAFQQVVDRFGDDATLRDVIELARSSFHG
jgi:tetratricopeptide (TPR) repeat protein